MGSSASKVSRSAGTAARKFPTKPSLESSTRTTNAAAQQAPPPAAANAQPGPTVRPQPHATGSRDEAINLDASDPDFARSLRSLGPVQPNPTLSPSSAFNQAHNAETGVPSQRNTVPDARTNPALAVLDARSRLQDAADFEFQQAGRRGHAGREFCDIVMIRQMLVQRDEFGKSAEEIEKRMGLKKGVVERLGPKGIIELVNEQGRADREVQIV